MIWSLQLELEIHVSLALITQSWYFKSIDIDECDCTLSLFLPIVCFIINVCNLSGRESSDISLTASQHNLYCPLMVVSGWQKTLRQMACLLEQNIDRRKALVKLSSRNFWYFQKIKYETLNSMDQTTNHTLELLRVNLNFRTAKIIEKNVLLTKKDILLKCSMDTELLLNV